MSWQIENNLLYETHLKNIPWLKHFFTLRANGDLRNTEIRKRICEKEKIVSSSVVSAEQVHRDKIFQVRREHRGIHQNGVYLGKRIPAVDALLTNCVRVPLVVFTADCLPIFLVETRKKIVGLAHAGREGTTREITYKTVKMIKDEYSSNPADLLVALGPHIHSCCYPVNLTKLNYEQLLSAGVKKKNIFISRYCTSCRNDLFFSYHKEKINAGRMMGLVMIC